MPRVAPLVELSAGQSLELERRVRARGSSVAVVARSRIVLLAAKGLPNQEIARTLGLPEQTVGKWRRRFIKAGVAGLEDAPRSGRPVSLPVSRLNTVLTEVTRPPPTRTQWSIRSMARHAGVSKSHHFGAGGARRLDQSGPGETGRIGGSRVGGVDDGGLPVLDAIPRRVGLPSESSRSATVLPIKPATPVMKIFCMKFSSGVRRQACPLTRQRVAQNDPCAARGVNTPHMPGKQNHCPPSRARRPCTRTCLPFCDYPPCFRATTKNCPPKNRQRIGTAR